VEIKNVSEERIEHGVEATRAHLNGWSDDDRLGDGVVGVNERAGVATDVEIWGVNGVLRVSLKALI